MFACSRHRKRLGAYLDGELSGPERASVERHLETCESCRSVLSGLKELGPLLGAFDAPPVPSGLTGRVMAAAVRPEREATTVGWNPLKWWRMSSRPMRWAAVGMPVAGLIVGFLLGWTSAPPTEPATAGAQPDPLEIYQIDYLGDSPAGSLADSYLALVAAGEEEGR